MEKLAAGLFPPARADRHAQQPQKDKLVGDPLWRPMNHTQHEVWSGTSAFPGWRITTRPHPEGACDHRTKLMAPAGRGELSASGSCLARELRIPKTADC